MLPGPAATDGIPPWEANTAASQNQGAPTILGRLSMLINVCGEIEYVN